MIRSNELSGEAARALVAATFNDLIADAEASGGFVPLSDNPDFEIAEQRFWCEERITDLQNQIATSRFENEVSNRVDRTMEGNSAVLTGSRHLDLMSGTARAMVEQQRLFLLRLVDRLQIFEPSDPFFRLDAEAPSLPVDTPRRSEQVCGPQLGTAIDLYLKAGERKWRTKTQTARIKQMGYLREHLGETRHLASITSHDVRSYRDAILSLGANHGRNRAMSFSERQTENTDRRIADKTAIIIFEPVKAFFRWCHTSEGMIESNPADGVRIQLEIKPKGKKSRRPFSAAELLTLFSAPLFTGCKSAHRRYEHGGKIIRDAKFWLPILGLYTGCRLGELVQLHISDVHLSGPIPFISINEDNCANTSGETKHVKSAAGIRSVPLHPDLIALGFPAFLDRVIRVVRRDTRRLFPEFSYGSDGQASTVASKFFGRFMNAAGLTDPALVFHSLRHNAEDAFRNAGQPQYVIDKIIGHSDGATSASYGEGIDLEVAYAAIKAMKLKVRVPEILGVCTNAS